ncbi:thyroid adenoma-associated protein homolog isoform X2 [Cimex lectularius]|nr:thyroid adenoma-associated protein homolog isoform X2 [Cimex lectularius]
MKHDQLPLDTKSNFGILCVMIFTMIYERFEWAELENMVNSTDDLDQLCVISGMLNSLSFDDLNSAWVYKGEENSVLACVVEIILDVEEKNSANCGLVLTCSRCLLLATKSILAHPALITESLVLKLLSHIWLHLEHSMDAVRHLASSTLSNLVAIGKKSENNFIFHSIVKDIANIPIDKRSNNTALSALIGSIPVADLLSNSPGLIDSLLLSIRNSTSVNHATSSFENLMKQHFKERNDFNEWYSLWVLPVLNFLLPEPNAALEHIMTTAIKVHNGVFENALKDVENPSWPFNLTLLIMRIGRKCGLLNGRRNTIDQWKGVLSYQTIFACIKGRDEDRVSTFALLTETQKSTELFEESDFSVIKYFLKYDINCQSLTIRQKSFGIFKKFITRFKDSLSTCERSVNAKESTSVSTDKKTLAVYESFKKWLINFLVGNLFPGANFARRGAALYLLSLCDEKGFWKIETQNESYVKSLLHCLLDSYEANKALAKKLLLKLPLEMLKLDDEAYVKSFLSNSISLASSIRPPDSISAAYFVSLLISVPTVDDILKKEYENAIQIPNLKQELGAYICLKLLLDQLQNELTLAKKSLLKASCSGPMYGLIFVIRHIFHEVNFKTVQDDECWKALTNEIIQTTFECDKTVAFVVNNSSPEGMLPMDFDYDVSQLGSDEEMPHVTSQMVLLCCWRTVKEVSLLLGELAQNAPISSEEFSGLISEDQVLSIGDHLTGLLSETKHRGAFEQAYVGFCKLASRLWRYPKGNLHQLPCKWMDETLNEISTNGELSATRRSAGIPFIVQGLVCTELDVGGGKCFHRGIQTLLELAQNKQSTVETRAHSLNILRALFRHSLLGEMVSPYVDKGLAVAIDGFNSNTWAERNSSTLLLSALVTRIFGVPRSSDLENLSWKNKMTGRIFFLKYPMLFDVLYKHLEAAAKSYLYPAINPVLLILGRLYPSSLEGTDSNLQLNNYIPLVSKCASSPILKTRSLAAFAIVALITPNNFVQHIDKCFEDIYNSRKENLSHGLLLQVLKLIRHMPAECIEMVQRRIHVWMLVLLHTLESGRHCYTVKECCLKIAYQFALLFYETISKEHWNKLFGILEQNLFCPDSIIDLVFPDFGCSGYLTHCVILLITLYYKRKSAKLLTEKVTYLIHHPEYIVMHVSFQFIITILEGNNLFEHKDINDMDPLKLDSFELNCELQEELLSYEKLAMSVVDMLETRSHHEDKQIILKAIKCLPESFLLIGEKNNQTVIEYLQNVCNDEPESVGALSLDCIMAFLRNKDNIFTITKSDFNIVCNLVKEYSHCDADFKSRKSVMLLFNDQFKDLVKQSQPTNAFIILNTELKLLNDDEEVIRRRNNSNELSTLENFFCELCSSYSDEIVIACLLLTWALGDCSLEEVYIDENSDRVFDKGDRNCYMEEVFINYVSCHKLSEVVKTNKSILNQQIPPYLLEWINEQTWLNTKSNSIQNIVDDFKNTISSICNSVKKPSPFRPMETKLFMMEIKLKNIVEAINGSYEEELILMFNQM